MVGRSWTTSIRLFSRLDAVQPLLGPTQPGQHYCGQLILRKICKTVATRCHILRPKCTKFDCRWGSAQDPARGPYSAPQFPNPLTVFKGPTSKERGGKSRKGEGCPSYWGLWMWHWKRGGKGNGKGGELGLGRSGTSSFQFKH